MKHLILLACIAVLYSCGHEKDVPENSRVDPALAAKYDTYVALNAAYPKGPHGWDNEDDCDALLFVSLTNAALGQGYDIESARDGIGQWYRNPSQTCYPDRSSSTISRDMFLGVYWYIKALNRPDLARQIFDYATVHSWIMGEGPVSRTFLTPNLASTLGIMTGEFHVVNGVEPVVDDSVTDFEAHLLALEIALRVRLGKATAESHVHAATLAARQPNNALFAAVLGLYTGDQQHAIDLLTSDRYWPADRLPTSSDHCTAWLTQRDEGDDWLPCPDRGLTHSGGDFLFAAALALGKL